MRCSPIQGRPEDHWLQKTFRLAEKIEDKTEQVKNFQKIKSLTLNELNRQRIRKSRAAREEKKMRKCT